MKETKETETKETEAEGHAHVSHDEVRAQRHGTASISGGRQRATRVSRTPWSLRQSNGGSSQVMSQRERSPSLPL